MTGTVGAASGSGRQTCESTNDPWRCTVHTIGDQALFSQIMGESILSVSLWITHLSHLVNLREPRIPLVSRMYFEVEFADRVAWIGDIFAPGSGVWAS